MNPETKLNIIMKNQLIPLTGCNNTKGEFEPSLIPSGFKYDSLVPVDELTNSLQTKFAGEGFSFRRDLIGKVHKCGGLPIIELDSGALFAVRNPSKTLQTDLSGKGWL